MTRIDYPAGYALLSQRLTGFGAFRKRWAWLYALAWFVILGPGSFLALVALDALVPLPWYILLSLCAVAAGLTVYAGITRALLPLLARIDIEREALVLESLHGKLDNQIIGSLQLGREVVEAQQSGRPVGYSIAIVSALVQRTADNIGAIDLAALVDRKKAFRDLSFAAAILLSFALLAATAPGVLAKRAERVRDAYATLMDLLFPVNIVVTPGDKNLVRGTAVELGVEIAKARRSNIRLIRTDLKTKKTTTDDLSLDADHRSSFPIAAAQESFTYEFEYGGRRTPAHKILVGDRPEIAAMNTELMYPLYTRMPSRTLIGRLPKIQTLEGTKVLVSIASTVDLDPKNCYWTMQGRSPEHPTVVGRFADFSFEIKDPSRITVELTGALGKGFEMSQPLSFEVAVQRDMPPTVDLLLSARLKAQSVTRDGVTLLAEEAAHFALPAIAEDDFAVTRMWLAYDVKTPDAHLNREARENLSNTITYTVDPRVDANPDRVKHVFTEVFKDVKLLPGDRVTMTVWANDNNTPPGAGKSQPFTFTVVQPDLGAYVEQQYAFGSDPLLGGLRRVQRATNLLIEAERTTHTEAKAPVEKQEVKSRVSAENWPGGSQDAVGDYFRLLSGEK